MNPYLRNGLACREHSARNIRVFIADLKVNLTGRIESRIDFLRHRVPHQRVRDVDRAEEVTRRR